jgi:hypothetical protein
VYPHHPLLSRSFHVAVLDGRAGAKRGNRRMKAKERKKSRVSPFRNDIEHEKARREQGFDFFCLVTVLLYPVILVFRIRLLLLKGCNLLKAGREASSIVSRGHFCCCDGVFSNVISHVMCMAEECLPGRPEMSDVSRCTPGVFLMKTRLRARAGEQGLLASS